VASSVRTFLPLVGSPTALVTAFDGDPGRWLPIARHEGPNTYTLTLRAGTLRRDATATVGSPWRVGSTHWRTLAWDPVADDGEPSAVDRLLPSLDGELGIHVESGGRVTLVLDARYRPPGGMLGLAVDAVALRRVARGTVERFLEDVTARLGAEALLSEGAGVGA
jgi:hypothetical protein